MKIKFSKSQWEYDEKPQEDEDLKKLKELVRGI